MGEVQGNALIFWGISYQPSLLEKDDLRTCCFDSVSWLHIATSVLVSVLALLAEMNMLWKSEKKNAGWKCIKFLKQVNHGEESYRRQK